MRISIPGGVAVSVVRRARDAVWVEGSEPSDAEWQRFSLSALLRALCPPPKMPCLRLLPPPLSPEEGGFLHAARAQLLYTPGSCTPHQECVPTEETLDDVTDVPFSTEKDMLTQLIYTYFAQAHRFEQALTFFAPLAAKLRVASMQQHQRELGLLPGDRESQQHVRRRTPTRACSLKQTCSSNATWCTGGANRHMRCASRPLAWRVAPARADCESEVRGGAPDTE